MKESEFLEGHPLGGDVASAGGDHHQEELAAASGARQGGSTFGGVTWRLIASAAFVVGAVVAFIVGYLGVSGTNDIYKQLPFFLSAGGVGVAMLFVAIALFVDYEHGCDRTGIAQLLQRVRSVEEALDGLQMAREGGTAKWDGAGETPRLSQTGRRSVSRR